MNKKDAVFQYLTKQCNVVLICRRYVLEEEVGANFSSRNILDLLKGALGLLPSNASVLRRQMIDFIRDLMYLEKTSSSTIAVDVIKFANKMLIHGEKHENGKGV